MSDASSDRSDGGASSVQATDDAGAGTIASASEGGTTSDGGASSNEGGARGEAGASGDVCLVVSWDDLNGTACTCAANNVTQGRLVNDNPLVARTFFCRDE